MMLSAFRNQVLSIAEKNSLQTEYDLWDAEFVPPNLEEQYIESEMAALCNARSSKSHQTWRLRELEDILKSFTNGQLAFVGPAGSGKTTLVKRIACSVIQGKNESLRNVDLVFIIDHVVEEENVKITGKNLLFRSLIAGGMHPQTVELVIKYAESNPDRVLFMLDGLDTMKFRGFRPPHKVRLYDEALPEEHLWNFLAGKYLGGCRIITSGRAHILRTFHEKVHPRRVVALTGFSRKSIEKVITGYLKDDQAEKVIKRLEREMKPLLSLCSSPAILKYTLCVIDNHDGPINTLTDLVMLILERLKGDHKNKSEIELIIQRLKLLSYDGVKYGDVVFTETHLQRYHLSEHQVTNISLRCAWGADFKLMKKRSHWFFTHMSMQEAFAALYLAALPRTEFEQFMRDEVNLPRFTLVRRLLHGILRANLTSYEAAKVSDSAYKRSLLYQNDEAILKEQISSNNSDYQEILEVFRCLYESQEMNSNLQSIIKSIELKNQPISASDAHIIGWIIGRCSVIEAVSFWNCTLTSTVFQTLEEALEGRSVQIGSFNIHENDGLDPEAMAYIGKMARHCNTNGIAFQGCEVSPEHIVKLERNLEKIKNLIFWKKTKMGKDFLSAILPLIPKVTNYLALDMWEVSKEDRFAIQDAVDELENSELKVNIYPDDKFIERRKPITMRSLSLPADGGPPVKRKRPRSTDQVTSYRFIPKRRRRQTLVVADRMLARIKEKISSFESRHDFDELDLSYLPLQQTDASTLASALTKKQKVKQLKLRSCIKQGFIESLYLQQSKVLEEVSSTVGHVDVSANPELGANDLMSLGILSRRWNTKCVDLSGCNCTSGGIISLKGSTNGHEIPKLLYNNNEVTPPIVTALSQFCATSSIVALHLRGCNLKPEKLQVLESEIPRTKLKTLDLSYNRGMTCEGYASIGRTVQKSDISTILLVYCDTVQQELESLRVELQDKPLTHLDLSYNEELVMDESRSSVAKTLELIKPRTLSLSGCGVDAEMLEEMAQSSIGIELTRLDIRDNSKLGQDSVHVVKTIISNLSLNHMDIANCGWTQNDIRSLPNNIRTVIRAEK